MGMKGKRYRFRHQGTIWSNSISIRSSSVLGSVGKVGVMTLLSPMRASEVTGSTPWTTQARRPRKKPRHESYDSASTTPRPSM